MAIASMALLAPPQVTVKAEQFRGWSAYRLSNGSVDMVVVPKIGRVMWFGFTGSERNVLWVNPEFDAKSKPTEAYANYGGDKLWPAPQRLWVWPPDPKLDGPEYQAKVIDNGIRLTSPVGSKFKIQFIRDITLDPLAPKARMHNRMDNLGDEVSLSVWEVTQVGSPDTVTLPFQPTGELSKGWMAYESFELNPTFHELKGGQLLLKRNPKQSRKFGAWHPSGTLTATFGSTTLKTKSQVYAGQKYPEASPLQVFLSADPTQYVELEHTSPIQRMQSGETAYLDVTWELSSGN